MGTDTLHNSDQIRTWTSDFGREYTDRNNYTPAQLDEFYRKTYGIARSELNRRQLAEVPKDARILEVGCNIGTQLLLLGGIGFRNLFGIEVQSYALHRAKDRLEDVRLVQASALSIPFPDRYFDLVFTSGVLIHIAPADLPVAVAEIHRCTKKWVWGMEYYAPRMSEIGYRDQRNLLWKSDYARLYRDTFDDLELVREERLGYLESENVDTMFLLWRRN